MPSTTTPEQELRSSFVPFTEGRFEFVLIGKELVRCAGRLSTCVVTNERAAFVAIQVDPVGNRQWIASGGPELDPTLQPLQKIEHTAFEYVSVGNDARLAEPDFRSRRREIATIRSRCHPSHRRSGDAGST